MPIRRNDSDSYPGANSLFVAPVTKADCCLFQTVQAMMEHARAQGWPATVKGGQCMVDASLAQIQTVCLIGEPEISSVVPDPLQEVMPWEVHGSNFGLVIGEVWLASHDTWEASTTKVRQTEPGWSDTLLAVSLPTMDGLPSLPEHVYVYVINHCGQRNAVGCETEYQAL